MCIVDGLNMLEAQIAVGETMSNTMIDCDANIGLVSPVIEVPLGLLEQWQIIVIFIESIQGNFTDIYVYCKVLYTVCIETDVHTICTLLTSHFLFIMMADSFFVEK